MIEISADVVARFRALDTEHVSDVMDDLGIRRGGCPGIYPVNPAHKVVGPAFTVQFRPSEEVRESQTEYIEMPGPGDVLVISNCGRLDCSVWGGQRTLVALRRGLAGSVLDGCYRDVRTSLGSDYPIFGLQPTMMRTQGIVRLAAVQVPVSVRGVEVEPGDLIMGDASGVLVVPASRAREVLAAAEHFAKVELRREDALRLGLSWDEARADNPG